MIRTTCAAILAALFRVSTAGPALTRYYILPHVKLHHIHSDDAHFHTHPWNGFSIIFGSYLEHTVTGVYHRRGFNRIHAHRIHKVALYKGRAVWTLFLHGRRINDNWAYGAAAKPWKGSDDTRKIGAS